MSLAGHLLWCLGKWVLELDYMFPCFCLSPRLFVIKLVVTVCQDQYHHFVYSFLQVDRHMHRLDHNLNRFPKELEADTAGVAEIQEQSESAYLSTKLCTKRFIKQLCYPPDVLTTQWSSCGTSVRTCWAATRSGGRHMHLQLVWWTTCSCNW